MKPDSKIQACEMAFLRRVEKCYKHDLVKNEKIWEDLEVFNLNERQHWFWNEYEQRWKEHLGTMSDSRLAKD